MAQSKAKGTSSIRRKHDKCANFFLKNNFFFCCCLFVSNELLFYTNSLRDLESRVAPRVALSHLAPCQIAAIETLNVISSRAVNRHTTQR